MALIVAEDPEVLLRPDMQKGVQVRQHTIFLFSFIEYSERPNTKQVWFRTGSFHSDASESRIRTVVLIPNAK